MEQLDTALTTVKNFDDVKRVIAMYNDVAVPEIDIVKYAKKVNNAECWLATEAVFEYLMTGIMPPVVERFLVGKIQPSPRYLKDLFFQHSPVRIVGETYGVRQRPILAGVLKEEVLTACNRYAAFEDDFEDFIDTFSSLVDFLVEPDLEFSHAVKLAKNIDSPLIASYFAERSLLLLPEEVRKELPLDEILYLFKEIQNNGKLVDPPGGVKGAQAPTPGGGGPGGGADPQYFEPRPGTPGSARPGVEARTFFGGKGPEGAGGGDNRGPGYHTRHSVRPGGGDAGGKMGGPDADGKKKWKGKKGGAPGGGPEGTEGGGPEGSGGGGSVRPAAPLKGLDSPFRMYSQKIRPDPQLEKDIEKYGVKLEEFLKEEEIPTFKGMKQVRLRDLIGMDDDKKQTLLEPFINTIYVAHGETVHANPVILLNGPPGTGKSFSMIALANEIGANVEIINGATIKNEFVGRTEKNFVRLIEAGIRSYDRTGQLSMILLDEAETLLPRKNTDNKSSQDILPLFNSYTSGPKKDDIEGKVVFVLTINNMDAIDPSVVNRAHRIDYEKPSLKEIRELFIQHTVGRGIRTDIDNIDWGALAKKGDGLVQREVVHICGAAKTAALSRCADKLGVSLYTSDDEVRFKISNKYLITQEDLEKAITRKREKKAEREGKAATEVMYG